MPQTVHRYVLTLLALVVLVGSLSAYWVYQTFSGIHERSNASNHYYQTQLQATRTLHDASLKLKNIALSLEPVSTFAGLIKQIETISSQLSVREGITADTVSKIQTASIAAQNALQQGNHKALFQALDQIDAATHDAEASLFAYYQAQLSQVDELENTQTVQLAFSLIALTCVGGVVSFLLVRNINKAIYKKEAEKRALFSEKLALEQSLLKGSLHSKEPQNAFLSEGLLEQLTEGVLWEFCLETQHFLKSPKFYQLIGAPENASEVSLESVCKKLDEYSAAALRSLLEKTASKQHNIHQALTIAETPYLIHTTPHPLYPGPTGRILGLCAHSRQAPTPTATQCTLDPFRSIVESLSECVAQTDQEGNITFLNSAWEKITQTPPKDALGRPLLDFLHPNDVEVTSIKLNFILEGIKESATLHARLHSKDKSNTRWVSLQISPIKGPGKHPLGLNMRISDITEEKLIGDELENSERLTRTFAQNVPLAIAMLDAKLHYVLASHKWCADYQTSEDKILKKSFIEVSSSNPIPIGSNYQQVLRGKSIHGESNWKRSDGKLEIVRWNLQPWYDSNQQISGIMVFSEFISEQHQKDQLLRTLSLAASKSTSGIILSDRQGKAKWMNQAIESITGYDLATLQQDSFTKLLAGESTGQESIKTIEANLAKSQSFRKEIILHRKDGRPFWADIDATAVWNEQEKDHQFITTINEITERKSAELELVNAKEEVEASNAALQKAIKSANEMALEAQLASVAKGSFLATMSHEIRTPMNAIICMAKLLEDTQLNPEQHEFVQTITTSGEALLVIINDVLDYSKIESGNINLESEEIELESCIEDALNLLAPKAYETKLELTQYIAPEVPKTVIGDITRLRQLLINLVGNAIKFTSKGHISTTVSLKAADLAKKTCRLEFCIEDTGIGIPADRIDKLFESFTQVDTSTTRRYGGTGLGLAICKRLCEAMNGSIHVESAPDQGSKFIFEIELAYDPDQKQARPPFKKERLGIITANKPLAESLKLRASALGLTPSILPFNKPLSSKADLDFCLLECPPTDKSKCQDLLKTLRKSEIPTALILTAGCSNTEQDIEVIRKPLKTKALTHVIKRLAGAAPQPEEPAPKSSPFNSSEKMPEISILVAEDNPVNQKVICKILAKLGYTADMVENGAEAINALQKKSYDVILMDIHMPVLDGIETSKAIQQNFPKDQRPWIIALTASVLHSDRQATLEAGMHDFLIKPIQIEELKKALVKAGQARQTALA